MEKKVFCPHCSQDALTYTVIRGDKEEVCCLYCGMLLERLSKDEKAVIIDSAPAGHKKKVMYADDSPFMREFLTDIFITQKDLIEDFIALDSGESLIYEFTKNLLDHKKTDLVILDIRMPHLSGIGAANAIRAIEKAFKAPQVPFLFFSAKQADEDLKKLIEHTAPAFFLNKGATNNIDELSKRLISIVISILGK